MTIILAENYLFVKGPNLLTGGPTKLTLGDQINNV